MLDKLTFKVINPNGKEDWAADYKINIVVEIYINDVELIEILKVIETPYAIDENHADLAGAYGHLLPDELYTNLATDEEDIELLCCSGCGESGCWSILVDVEKDDKFIYWKMFKHNHRDWKYDISYKFDRMEYEKSLVKLCELSEDNKDV